MQALNRRGGADVVLPVVTDRAVARVEHAVQFGDLLRFVDFDYLAGVTRVNVAMLATLADAPDSPAKARLIAVELTNTTTLTWDANTEPDLAGYEVVSRDTTAPLATLGERWASGPASPSTSRRTTSSSGCARWTSRVTGAPSASPSRSSSPRLRLRPYKTDARPADRRACHRAYGATDQGASGLRLVRSSSSRHSE